MQVPLLQHQQQQQRCVPYLYVSNEPLHEEFNDRNGNEVNDDDGSADEEYVGVDVCNEGDSDDKDGNSGTGGALLNLEQIAVEIHVSVDDLVRALQNSSTSSSNDSRLDQNPCLTVITSDGTSFNGSEEHDFSSIGDGKNTSREKRNGSSDNNSSRDVDDRGGRRRGGGRAPLHRNRSKDSVDRGELLQFSVEGAAAIPTLKGKHNREVEEHLQEAMGSDSHKRRILVYSSSGGDTSHYTRHSPVDSRTRTINTAPSSSSSFSTAVVLLSSRGVSSSSRTSTPPVMERAITSASQHSKRRIRFGSRVVSSVSVYSVDSGVYLGMHFQQHWSSWAALLCGFLLESLFEVHLMWFTNVEGGKVKATIPVAHWVYTYRLILSMAYALAWLPFYRRRLVMNRSSDTTTTTTTTIINGDNNSNSNGDNRRYLGIGHITDGLCGLCLKGLSMTFLSSMCFSLATATMIVSSEMAGSSLLFTATVMHSVWILLYRVVRKQMIFFIECFGTLLLIIGNVLCNVDSTRTMGARDALYGNILMTCGSLLFAAAFLLIAFGLQRRLCSTVSITVAVGVELFLITLVLGVCYDYPMMSSSSGGADTDTRVIAGFVRAHALHAFLLALEDLLFSLMYLYALVHLDVLSVSACSSLKVAIVPIVAHYAVWQHAAVIPPVVQARWGPLLFAGAATVATAAAAVMYFASVRRRFVARRLFHLRGLRPVPNPYLKKSRTRRQRPRP